MIISVYKRETLNKEKAIMFGNPVVWGDYHTFRNKVNSNRQKTNQYYQTKFKQCSNDSKNRKQQIKLCVEVK